MTTIAVGHIVLDDQGVARLEGSRIKVIHLVMEKMANNWTPEELQRQFTHLSLTQVYAALAYYHGHREEFDRQIRQSIDQADEGRNQAGESAIARRLREAGKLA